MAQKNDRRDYDQPYRHASEALTAARRRFHVARAMKYDNQGGGQGMRDAVSQQYTKTLNTYRQRLQQMSRESAGAWRRNSQAKKGKWR